MGALKEEVEIILKHLPEDSTLEDMQYGLYVLEKIKRGLADADAGRTLTQKEVERRATTSREYSMPPAIECHILRKLDQRVSAYRTGSRLSPASSGFVVFRHSGLFAGRRAEVEMLRTEGHDQPENNHGRQVFKDFQDVEVR